MNSCIKSRLPRWWRGSCKRCCAHSHNATSFSSVRHTPSSSLASAMSSRVAAQLITCQQRAIHSSRCINRSSFVPFQPFLSHTNNNAADNNKTLSTGMRQQSSSPNNIICHQSPNHPPLIAPNTPLPPPLPKPTYSFRGRILPPNLLAFNSTEGKGRFLESLQSNHAESYFPLSQQFLNQMDPAYCGISTLILVLNALAMDPNVRWRGGWRWYGDESMLLERCCLEQERVAREGITMEQYCGLARCQGAGLVMK